VDLYRNLTADQSAALTEILTELQKVRGGLSEGQMALLLERARLIHKGAELHSQSESLASGQGADRLRTLTVAVAQLEAQLREREYLGVRIQRFVDLEGGTLNSSSLGQVLSTIIDHMVEAAEARQRSERMARDVDDVPIAGGGVTSLSIPSQLSASSDQPTEIATVAPEVRQRAVNSVLTGIVQNLLTIAPYLLALNMGSGELVVSYPALGGTKGLRFQFDGSRNLRTEVAKPDGVDAGYLPFVLERIENGRSIGGLFSPFLTEHVADSKAPAAAPNTFYLWVRNDGNVIAECDEAFQLHFASTYDVLQAMEKALQCRPILHIGSTTYFDDLNQNYPRWLVPILPVEDTQGQNPATADAAALALMRTALLLKTPRIDIRETIYEPYLSFTHPDSPDQLSAASYEGPEVVAGAQVSHTVSLQDGSQATVEAEVIFVEDMVRTNHFVR
jgi:hypothetical protein